MHIDLQTFAIVQSITISLLVVALLLQYLTNKTYRGLGWWALNGVFSSVGFAFQYLRHIETTHLFFIVAANTLFVLGAIFLYIGCMRFLDKKENRVIIVPVFILFILSIVYYTFIEDSTTFRTLIVSVTTSIFAFLTAQALFFNKTRLITSSANFLAAVFIGRFFYLLFRAVACITFIKINNYFEPSLMQISLFLGVLLESFLLTFGFIIMVNQRLNEEMRESKEQFELIFNTSPDAVVISHWGDNIIVNINNGFKALTGYSREETIGKSPRDFVNWKKPGERQSITNELTKIGFINNIEMTLKKKNGTEIVCILSAKLITLLGIPHVISVIRDITDRKKAEEEVISMNRELEERVRRGVEEIREMDNILIVQSRQAAMGEMMNNIAHQWRQPLNALGILIQNIGMAFEMDKLDQVAINKFNDKGIKLVQHMSQTIDDFRNFFIADKVKKQFLVGDVLKKTISLIDQSLSKSNIDIKIEIENDFLITGFPNEFGQVLINLLQNAKDAFLERKTKNPLIIIKLSKEGSNFCVTVTDNAGGIPNSILDKIFDPYFTTKEDGTGVGLYMSKMIIEKNMNGKLIAANTEDGAVFTIVV